MKQTLLFLFFIATLISCKEVVPSDKDGEFKIVTTTGMLADVAKAIVGEHATVEALMGPGVDPHLYKATQGDLTLLKQADIIIYNGLHLEGKMGEVLEKVAKFPNKTVVAAGEVIPEEQLLLVDPDNHIYDPHIWFDVQLWSNIIQPIQEAIVGFDATHAEEYRANAQIKKQELDSLHSWVVAQILSIPEEQRILITAHDAFEYFGRAYGIKVEGLQGISTISEAGIKDVSNLVDQLVNENIKAVFVESSVPKKTIEAVVEGANEKGHDVEIGGTLFSDAMGAADSPEGNYDGMVRHNVNTIVNALK